MVLARNFSISCETSIQHVYVLHIFHIKPAPSGEAAITLTADLPRKQPNYSVLNAVVMRFDDPLFVLISESD
jgi:hypothetical protein